MYFLQHDGGYFRVLIEIDVDVNMVNQDNYNDVNLENDHEDINMVNEDELWNGDEIWLDDEDESNDSGFDEEDEGDDNVIILN